MASEELARELPPLYLVTRTTRQSYKIFISTIECQTVLRSRRQGFHATGVTYDHSKWDWRLESGFKDALYSTPACGVC